MDMFRTLGSGSLSVTAMLDFSGKANTSIHVLGEDDTARVPVGSTLNRQTRFTGIINFSLSIPFDIIVHTCAQSNSIIMIYNREMFDNASNISVYIDCSVVQLVVTSSDQLVRCWGTLPSKQKQIV